MNPEKAMNDRDFGSGMWVAMMLADWPDRNSAVQHMSDTRTVSREFFDWTEKWGCVQHD